MIKLILHLHAAFLQGELAGGLWELETRDWRENKPYSGQVRAARKEVDIFLMIRAKSHMND